MKPERKPGWGCARQVRALHKPRALQLPVCVHPAKRVLAAGMAPTCLQRALQQQSKPPRKLAKICDWIGAPAPRPHLLPDPLFGTCLEDVLKTSPRTVHEGRETEAKRVEIPPYPDSLTHPKKGQRIPHKGAHSPAQFPHPRPGRPPHTARAARPKPVPHTHPTQASLELLARRAGGYRTVSRLSTQQKMAKWAVPFFSAASPRPSLPGSDLSTRADSGLQPGWLARLSRRLSYRFRETPPFSALTGSAQTEEFPTGELDETAGAAGNVSSWVARAVAVEPTGPTAPLTLLLRLLGEAEPLSENPPVRRAPPVRGAKPSPTELLRSQAERTASGVPEWDAPFSSTPRGEAPAPVVQPPTGAQQGFYPQSGSLPLPAAGQPNFRPPLAPPLASEHTPTLLPPQEVFDAPTPFAAATARQAAKFDEGRLVEEDLDMLASKIKRILDDEARRHGIQVE